MRTSGARSSCAETHGAKKLQRRNVVQKSGAPLLNDGKYFKTRKGWFRFQE